MMSIHGKTIGNIATIMKNAVVNEESLCYTSRQVDAIIVTITHFVIKTHEIWCIYTVSK